MSIKQASERSPIILGKLLPTINSRGIAAKFKNLFTGPSAYLWFSFSIPVVIMYLIYLAMEIHPFGDGSVLVLDLNAQYVYFYEALHDFVWGDSSLLYSFSRQLGGEFMGIYAYYIASPFSYIVALFPRGMILESLLIVFLIKTGITGFTCGFYLSRITDKDKLNKTNVVIFSCLYALCSYAIVHQSNSMWIDALMWLPILTYAIEQLIKFRKFKLYVIILALIMMSNYYLGYMSCIYTAIYFFYYYAAHSQNGEHNPLGEKTHFAKSLLRMIVYSALAIGISAVIIFTAYYSLTFGKNTFSDPSWDFKLNFDMMDYLTKFLPGSYDTVRRAGLPFVYCGVLVLFMLPVYFISGKRTTREKAMSGLMIVLFSLFFMINIIDLLWHGMQAPNWLNYRYSFMLSFLLVVMAYKGFCDVDSVSSKVHMATAGFITLFLVIAQKYTFKSYNKEQGAPLDAIQTIAFTLICVGAYLIILSIYKKSFEKRQSIGILLTIVVCLELFANGLSNVVGFDKDVIYSSYSSYHSFIDKFRPTVDYVLDSDTSFYRMEKINHRRTNDNMALNIRGLSNSSSTLNRETVTFLANLGYASAAHKSIYKGGNIVNDSLLGLRYFVAANDEFDEALYPYHNNATSIQKHDFRQSKALKEMFGNEYELYYSDENCDVYYNPYALSIAFAVSDKVSDFKFLDDKEKAIYFNPFDKTNAVISSMLGSDETVEIFKPLDDYEEALSNLKLTGVADKHNTYKPIDGGSKSTLTYTMTVPRDGEIYFYLPTLYSRRVILSLDGEEYGEFHGDDSTRMMLLGYFEKGDELKLDIKLTGDVLYVKNNVSTFYYIDEEVFKESFSKLAETQLVIDDKYSEDHLKGTITTVNNSQTVQTTIPYDEGWIVTVDGKKVETYKTFDALVAFDIEEAGEHRVELKYRSKPYVFGMMITVCSIIIFAVLVIFEKKIYYFIYTKFYNERVPLSQAAEKSALKKRLNAENDNTEESAEQKE